MILFLGDSFTWGQGLEWELMISEGIDVNEINKIIPPDFDAENLPYKYQIFREKNRFPSLVSKHFDVQNHIARFGNGGNNYDNKFILSNLEAFIDVERIKLIVFQFTHSQRAGHTMTDDEYLKLKNNNNVIEDDFLDTLDIINNKFKNSSIKLLFLSWLPEFGDLFESNGYGDIFCKIQYNLKKSNGFECLLEDVDISNKTCLGYKYDSLKDHHLSIEGHQVIAESIIKKIDTMDINFIKPNLLVQ